MKLPRPAEQTNCSRHRHPRESPGAKQVETELKSRFCGNDEAGEAEIEFGNRLQLSRLIADRAGPQGLALAGARSHLRLDLARSRRQGASELDEATGPGKKLRVDLRVTDVALTFRSAPEMPA